MLSTCVLMSFQLSEDSPSDPKPKIQDGGPHPTPQPPENPKGLGFKLGFRVSPSSARLDSQANSPCGIWRSAGWSRCMRRRTRPEGRACLTAWPPDFGMFILDAKSTPIRIPIKDYQGQHPNPYPQPVSRAAHHSSTVQDGGAHVLGGPLYGDSTLCRRYEIHARHQSSF